MITAIDVDDVLAAFTPHAHNYFGKKLEVCDYWSVEGMANKLCKGWFVDIIQHDINFWKTLPILSPPRTITFEFDYYISSFPEHIYDERAWWLVRNKYPVKPLIHSMDKVEKCKELGVDLLIDDKPKTVVDIRNAGLKALHFIAPYAGFKPEGDSITSLRQVKNYL